MKLGQPLLTTKLSGKLGGVVGASARGGVLYARRRVDGSNPQTPNQALVRSVIAVLSGAWMNTLTEAQRNSWAAKAKPEESGIDVYVRGNFQQLLTGQAAAVATAPASVALDDIPWTDTGNYVIADEQWAADAPAGTAIKYAMYITAPQSASRAARQFPFVYLQTVAPGSGPIDIEASGRLAGVTAGQVFYVKIVGFGSASPKLGRVGQEQVFRVPVVA